MEINFAKIPKKAILTKLFEVINNLLSTKIFIKTTFLWNISDILLAIVIEKLLTFKPFKL